MKRKRFEIASASYSTDSAGSSISVYLCLIVSVYMCLCPFAHQQVDKVGREGGQRACWLAYHEMRPDVAQNPGILGTLPFQYYALEHRPA